MSVHLHHEIEKLKRSILELGSKVEGVVRDAVSALEGTNQQLAEKVIAADTEIDTMEVEIEESCLKILALHQPVAGDLRFVISCLKVNNDLERVADLAAEIVRSATKTFKSNEGKLVLSIDPMLNKAETMLKLCLDAITNVDIIVAKQVIGHEIEANQIHASLIKDMLDQLNAKPKKAETFVHFLDIVDNLKRVCDYSTNIAEDVIYMVTGEIVRHNKKLQLH